MLNLYDTLLELEEKGCIQIQAKNLCTEEKEYKRLIAKYRDNELLQNKYKIRLENVKNEMMYLNTETIEICKVLDEIMKYNDIEVFIDAFNLDWDEYDEDEDFYSNLMISATPIGHCIRQGLLQNEKMVKDII
ncbi:hypothetical protein [Clostridium sp. JS66]|uniref:hypothetical protein n=1 Tax=Clostridium sp. JS66 TaxID=3064705 RepID=UPI00298EB727|nr:hypothetical protein [Clostridium sp. JS66]WPC42934.1 hypothetical protein Q6H37_05535 [Clostridium sp. JS66]